MSLGLIKSMIELTDDIPLNMPRYYYQIIYFL